MNLPTYENIQTVLIDIKPKAFINFSITPNLTFAEDVWSFKEFRRFSSEEWAYTYDYSELDITYKNYAKYTILRELFSRRNRFTTVKAKFYVIRSFIDYLSEHQMFFPNLIDVPLLEDFLSTTKITERALTDKKQALKLFLSEIELRVPNLDFSECYSYLNNINTRKVKREREAGKHKFIPIELHNQIISLAIKDIRNENLPIERRASACMVVLMAETGMRVGEFRMLEVNKLDTVSIKGETEVFHFLNFKTYKTVKESDFKMTRSFITENALFAYQTLTEIHSDKRTTNYLFVKHNGTEVSKTMLRYRLVEFFYNHQDELRLEEIIDHEVKQFAVTSKNKFQSLAFVPNDEMDKKIYYVTFHQYRVVLATILYEKGYHLDFIRQHMNHLTEEMTQHYIRLNEIEKKETNAIDTLMRRTSQDGSTLITDINETSDKHIREELQNEQYQEMYEQINKFLKKKKMNIFKDIKELVKILSRNDTPMADMELGICAKSFNKLCERNEFLSTINDAYYLGNQIHSLEDLPYSLKRFEEKAKIISYNESLYKKNPKYRNEFEREIKGIKIYIKRKLNPELLLLRKEISEIGLLSVRSKYPKLSEIIGNINDIEKEVQEWSEKTLLPQQRDV
ncbi:tyrosine-type recombinase/integrase [Solibacillus isronensis]|uniref:tyrosine-type recombinase/integrase n=1 Tax=Solibacillus isronensis TaxID=412383 RepID=UPI0020CA7C79|nr:tyrosine-type recombinase/integrase [Solibacillus isronensis]